MKPEGAHKIQKPEENNRVQRPTQTGFSSPATHYNEPRIDLNAVLISNTEATFFMRIIDDSYNEVGISIHDVIIVDKSLVPKHNQLAVVILEGSFQIIRINKELREEMNLWGVITYIIKSAL
jgi:DNA polymerase V